LGFSPRGVKWEDNHSSPSSADVKKTRFYILSPISLLDKADLVALGELYLYLIFVLFTGIRLIFAVPYTVHLNRFTDGDVSDMKATPEVINVVCVGVNIL
jgi:hypothetical protein